ncbi:MAG: FtsX-like permease family protein, partial [Gammaproteobacteria bacterium]|nr:FtsX-like permease family protein [Gammaproteobacteria bacterium]
ERMREFGLLQALGMLPRLILSLVLLESLFLIGIGALLGFVTGVATVLAFHDGIDMGVLAKGAMMIGAGRMFYPEINLLQAVYIVLFVWIMGVITSIYPAYRASREVPVAIINRN